MEKPIVRPPVVEEVAQRPSPDPRASMVEEVAQRPSPDPQAPVVEEVAQRPSPDPQAPVVDEIAQRPSPDPYAPVVEEVAQRPSRDPERPKRDPAESDPEEFARKILLDQLTGQARSRHELAQRLAKRNVPEEIAARLLDRFEEVGLIDDEAFARAWVDSRQRTRGLARPALAQELRRKGIDDETARTVLAEVDRDDEAETARALVRKKLRTLRSVDEQVAARRLVGLLARKGYSSGMAFAIVREELRLDAAEAD